VVKCVVGFVIAPARRNFVCWAITVCGLAICAGFGTGLSQGWIAKQWRLPCGFMGFLWFFLWPSVWAVWLARKL